MAFLRKSTSGTLTTSSFDLLIYKMSENKDLLELLEKGGWQTVKDVPDGGMFQEFVFPDSEKPSSAETPKKSKAKKPTPESKDQKKEKVLKKGKLLTEPLGKPKKKGLKSGVPIKETGTPKDSHFEGLNRKKTKALKRKLREDAGLPPLETPAPSSNSAKKAAKKAKKRKVVPEEKDSEETPEPEAPEFDPNWEDAFSSHLEDDRLAAWTQYQALSPALLSTLVDRQFFEPTPVQLLSLPESLTKYKDVVVAAVTGSGKTLAYVLPILHNIHMAKVQRIAKGNTEKQWECLAVMPTRELAIQVGGEFTSFAAKFPKNYMDVVTVIGGFAIVKQQRLLKKKPEIVVGTPGRLHALLGFELPTKKDQAVLDAHVTKCEWLRTSLVGLKYLVLDEADRLVDKGHFKELHTILGALTEATKKQSFIFSATLTFSGMEDAVGMNDRMKTLSDQCCTRGSRYVYTLDLTQNEEAKQNLRLPELLKLERVRMWDTTRNTKEANLLSLLLNHFFHLQYKRKKNQKSYSKVETPKASRVLVFVNAVNTASRLCSLFNLLFSDESLNVGGRRDYHSDVNYEIAQLGVETGNTKVVTVDRVCGLHSNLRQKDRVKKLEQFKEATHGIMVATDVSARGLDISDIDFVVHFHVARTPEIFVHRTGRTARAGNQGTAYILYDAEEETKWKKNLEAVKSGGFSGIPERSIPLKDLKYMERAIILGTQVENAVHKLVKARSQAKWKKTLVNQCDLPVSDEEIDSEDEHDDKTEKRRHENSIKASFVGLQSILSERLPSIGRF